MNDLEKTVIQQKEQIGALLILSSRMMQTMFDMMEIMNQMAEELGIDPPFEFEEESLN